MKLTAGTLMINLTMIQRDFLDRFYTEYLKSEYGPVTQLAAAHGFYYEHFGSLFESYKQAWGEEWNDWVDRFPPITTSARSLVFPWDSIEALESQLSEEGTIVNRLPRSGSTS
jgi:hypothetical protein